MFDGITVLMPVYNGEAFLREAIDSILNQTYKNFEFLIIDDGSTDESINIIKSYNDPRIILIQNDTNLGITKTLNKGIELSNYELIARMDADDISDPSRLQKQFDFFIKKPHIALLATWAKEFSNNKKEIVYELNPSYYYYNLVCECWIYHPTVMFRKSTVENVGKYQYTYCEDYDLWWRLSRHYEIDVLPEVLMKYRISDNSISMKTKKLEYDNAHREQLIRNVHYYTGDSVELTKNDIDFLMLKLNTISENNSINVFLKLFKKLETIDAFIFQKEIEKYPIKTLYNAAQDKKDRIVFKLLSYYSLRQVISLLLQLGYIKLAAKYLTYGILKKFRK